MGSVDGGDYCVAVVKVKLSNKFGTVGDSLKV